MQQDSLYMPLAEGLKIFLERLTCWVLCNTYIELQLRKWIYHFRESELKSCLERHICTYVPQNWTYLGKEHFLFVLSAEGEKMQWVWNADFFFSCYLWCKYLFEREMTHWIMRSLSVRSVWPGQSLHFSPKMCICWRNVFLDSRSFFKQK